MVHGECEYATATFGVVIQVILQCNFRGKFTLHFKASLFTVVANDECHLVDSPLHTLQLQCVQQVNSCNTMIM